MQNEHGGLEPDQMDNQSIKNLTGNKHIYTI
jgi:hypothetical protein